MDDRRMSEQERRETAFEQRGDLVENSDEIVRPRKIPQMISLRLEPGVVAQLRDLAARRGVTVSDLLREGADHILSTSQAAATVSHFRYSSTASGHTVSGGYAPCGGTGTLSALSRTA